jgi:hypothetical protein
MPGQCRASHSKAAIDLGGDPTLKTLATKTVFPWALLALLSPLALVLAARCLGQSDDNESPAQQSQRAATTETSGASDENRLREGANIHDRIGRFEFTGDRITFYPVDSGEPLRALENLSLERIARVLEETRGQREWSVSGTVTEYQGSNFILVTRAVVRAKGSDIPSGN